MSQGTPFVSVHQSCDTAVPVFIERLQQSGLQVVRTFNLRETNCADAQCTCPNHGTEQCDCQMVVLLVYGNDGQPASLIAHGHHGQTWLSLAEFFDGGNSRLERQIRGVLAPPHLSAQDPL